MSESSGGIKLRFYMQNLVLELSLDYMKALIIPFLFFLLYRDLTTCHVVRLWLLRAAARVHSPLTVTFGNSPFCPLLRTQLPPLREASNDSFDEAAHSTHRC
jgi:hypothetical protein